MASIDVTETKLTEGTWRGFIFPLQKQREHEAGILGVYCMSAMVEGLSLCTYLEGQNFYRWKPEEYVCLLISAVSCLHVVGSC